MESLPFDLDGIRSRALRTGLLASVLLLLGSMVLGFGGTDPGHGVGRLFFSYLSAFVFWLGVALGSMAIAMLHQLSGGAWGTAIRPVLESSMRTIPLMGLLFLPLLLGLEHLYEWARPEAHEHPMLVHKAPYLNVPFFVARTLAYFAVWLSLSHFFTRWSRAEAHGEGSGGQRKLRMISGAGLVLYGLTVTFSSIDWVMSLDPEWFSTIFGVLFMGGQALAALSFGVLVLVLISGRGPMSRYLRHEHLHDLGKLLLAFVMLWAYFNFSQFLIIWAGNLPEEIPWYLRRLQGPWNWVGLFLVLFHFVLPFLLLLSRDLKRRASTLLKLALLLLFMRWVDIVWLIVPEFHGHALPAGSGLLLDFVALVAVGGFWVWLFVTCLKTQPVLPPDRESADPV